MMNEFIVTTKTTTQFFSEKTYIDNGYKLDFDYIIERFVLSKSLAMFNHFTIEKVTNHFSNSVFYNDQLWRDYSGSRETLITYNAHTDMAKVLPYEDIHKSHAEYAANSTPFYAPLSV